MSNSEQIAQVAHDKWVTVSDSLRLLMINERMSESLVFGENLLFAHSLTKNKQFTFFVRFCPFFVSLKKTAIPSFPLFYWALWVNCSGRSPKMSNVSESLRLLTKHERMGESLVFLSKLLFRSLFAHFFLQKMSDLLRKPMNELPALPWTI